MKAIAIKKRFTGFPYEIAGSILRPYTKSGKQKYFVIARLHDCKETRGHWSDSAFDNWLVDNASDYGYTQKQAASLPHFSEDDLANN